MMFEAYAASQILEQLNEFLINFDELTDKQKSLIGEKLGEVSFKTQDGASEYIQLLDLGCCIIGAYA
jgi:replication factor C subunit 2/4